MADPKKPAPAPVNELPPKGSEADARRMLNNRVNMNDVIKMEDDRKSGPPYRSGLYEKGGSVETPPYPKLPLANYTSGVPYKPFDPKGSEYDHATQKIEGMEFDQQMVEGDDVPHNPSRVPRTGMLLKGSNHPTFNLGVDVDRKLGYGLDMQDGRYYTRPFAKHEHGGMVGGSGCKHGSSTVVGCKTKDGG